MSTPNHPVDELHNAVTPIQYPSEEGHATGFYFSPSNGDDDDANANCFYLVTNHHVVADEDGEPIDESIRVLTRPDAEDPTVTQFHDIPLTTNGQKNWIEHPDGSEIDLVAIPMNPLAFHNSSTRFFSAFNFRPDEIRIQTGTEAVVISYPIRGTSPYFPIVRDAMIASPYGERFQGLPCFAIDADMHSGTSGSPVITQPSPVQQTESGPDLGGYSPFHLLGIHSATLPSDHDESEGPLNINIEWYAELLTDMDLSPENYVEIMNRMNGE